MCCWSSISEMQLSDLFPPLLDSPYDDAKSLQIILAKSVVCQKKAA